MEQTSEKIYEWNLLFYTFTDNELQEGSFKDLAKLTSLNQKNESVIIHILLDTMNMGSYLIKIKGNPYKKDNIRMTRLERQNMSKEDTLQSFLYMSTYNLNLTSSPD